MESFTYKYKNNGCNSRNITLNCSNILNNIFLLLIIIFLFLLFLGRTFNLKIGIREIVAKTIKIILTNKRDNLDIIKTPTIED